MHKVVIVDDEVLARNHLMELIPWEQHGYRLCGVFDSGSAAIERLGDIRPDIIISDVYMPGVDGIGLSDYVRRARLTARMIMLSSYDRYEYVRATFKNGASDYLLKDRLTSAMLLSVLEKSMEGRADASAAAAERDGPPRQERGAASRSRMAEVRRRVRDALLGIGAGDEDGADLPEEIGIGRPLAVFGVRLLNGELLTGRLGDREKREWLESLLALHEKQMKGIMVHIEGPRFAILLPLDRAPAGGEQADELARYVSRLTSLLAKFMNVRLDSRASALCLDVRDLPGAFAAAMAGLAGDGAPSAEAAGSRQPIVGLREERELLGALERLDPAAAEGWIRELYAAAAARAGGPAGADGLRQLGAELLALAGRAARQLQAERALPLACPPIEEPLRALPPAGADDPADAAVRIYKELIRRASSARRLSPYVRKALAHMQEAFREDISLADSAARVGIHPAYLSRLFRQELGASFVEHLNGIRIEAAKSLIAAGVKIKDIYENVGFNNYSYFFKVFKLVSGMTPAEYEKGKRG